MEVTGSCLDRIDRIAGALNCFVRVDRQEALAAARQADQAIFDGLALGSLHGVPLAHKDCFYRNGRRSVCGTPARRNFVAERTSTALRRLDAAGAIDLGTLHMAEWAFGATGHNAHFGPCRNPWNSERISGGSSSGSGAAVAARLVFGSLGTDLGGSVRLPATFCGIVGLKPTVTRVSRYGVLPMSYSLEHVGVLARTVRDCARLLGVIAGHDPLDPTCSRETVPDFEAALGRGVKGVRIAVPDEAYLGFSSEEVRAVYDEAVLKFQALGAKLVRVTLPDMETVDALAHVVQMAEAATLHKHLLETEPEAYSDQVRQRIEPGLFIPAVRYLEALHLRAEQLTKFIEAAFGRADLLISPTVAMATPTIEESDVRGDAAMPALIGSMVRYTRCFSYLGLPCLVVPAGVLRDGLPMGVQLVGPPFHEAVLLSTASAYESNTPWHAHSPELNAAIGTIQHQGNANG